MNERLSQKQPDDYYTVGIDVIRVIYARRHTACDSDIVYISPNVPEGALLDDGSVYVDSGTII